MEVELIRYRFCEDSTGGLLMIDRKFSAYTCEDAVRDVKVYGKTCIPEGRYQIKFRTEGGMNSKYAALYPEIHKGMLWLQDVPNFQWVYLHKGNYHTDTEGCPLVGETPNKASDKSHIVFSSAVAYQRMYKHIANALDDGEKVFITVRSLYV